jgi:hypothetical protein
MVAATIWPLSGELRHHGVDKMSPGSFKRRRRLVLLALVRRRRWSGGKVLDGSTRRSRGETGLRDARCAPVERRRGGVRYVPA